MRVRQWSGVCPGPPSRVAAVGVLAFLMAAGCGKRTEDIQRVGDGNEPARVVQLAGRRPSFREDLAREARGLPLALVLTDARTLVARTADRNVDRIVSEGPFAWAMYE